jgi:uncharacterized protein (DUF1697 family)
MTIYIALLRGINVGGNNIIKMQDLRTLLQERGLENVNTYIQSGNIVFRSEKSAEQVQILIEQEIKNKYGYSIHVIVRTASEWDESMKNCPYPTETLGDGESVHLTLLGKEISKEEIEQLLQFQSDSEECLINDKEVYLYLRKSILDSKISNQLQKLGIPVTSRNWKTIKKIESMVKKMGA